MKALSSLLLIVVTVLMLHYSFGPILKDRDKSNDKKTGGSNADTSIPPDDPA